MRGRSRTSDGPRVAKQARGAGTPNATTLEAAARDTASPCRRGDRPTAGPPNPVPRAQTQTPPNYAHARGRPASSSPGSAGPAPPRCSRSSSAHARGRAGRRALQAALPARRGAGDRGPASRRAGSSTSPTGSPTSPRSRHRSGHAHYEAMRAKWSQARPTSATRWSRSASSTCGRRCPTRGSSASCATSSRSRRAGRPARGTPTTSGWAADQDATKAVAGWNRSLRRVRRAVKQRPDRAVVVEYDRFFGDATGASLDKVLAWLGLDRSPGDRRGVRAGARDVRREGGAQAAHPLPRDARVPRRARRARRLGPGDTQLAL